MFNIGDKIFYPLHGAGFVEAIEEREILGKKELYYILNMVLRKLQVMVPIGKTEGLEIRDVVGLDVLERALAMFKLEESGPTIPTKLRQKINMDKLKSGDIYEGVEVIMNLTSLSSKKKLGMDDKTMLDNAKQLLISELVISKGIAKDEATQLINI